MKFIVRLQSGDDIRYVGKLGIGSANPFSVNDPYDTFDEAHDFVEKCREDEKGLYDIAEVLPHPLYERQEFWAFTGCSLVIIIFFVIAFLAALFGGLVVITN